MYGNIPIKDVEASTINNMNKVSKQVLEAVMANIDKASKKRLTAAEALVIVRSAAAKIHAEIAPILPCKAGCSHCCKQSVMVLPVEAKIIANTYKLKMHTPEIMMGADAYVEMYHGVPCPFLKDNACSIYAERPMACRTFWNVTEFTELCNNETNLGAGIPNINTKKLDDLLVKAIIKKHSFMLNNKDIYAADIREWFPEV